MSINWDDYEDKTTVGVMKPTPINWEQHAENATPSHNQIMNQIMNPEFVKSAGEWPIASLPKRLVQMGRGFSEIGQGGKQALMQLGEELGYLPEGSVDKYTQEKLKEKQVYENTPYGKDPFGKFVTGGTKQIPLLMGGAPAYAARSTLLPAMLKGALGGAGIGATEFLSDPENRLPNIIGGGLIGAAAGTVPNIASKIMNLPSAIKTLSKDFNPRNWVNTIQKSHDILDTKASNIYDLVKERAQQQGKIYNIDPNTLQKAEDYLPKTRAYKNLIEKAKTGDYQAIHKLQSDLGKKGFKAKTSKSLAENDLGDEMLDLRDNINELTENKFKEYGQDYLAKLLNEGRQQYRKLKDTYYSHNTLGKLVNPSTRKVPKNIPSFLSEESKQMEKLFKQHPEIKKEVEEFYKQKELKDKLNKYYGKGKNISLGALGLGTVGGGLYLGNRYLSGD